MEEVRDQQVYKHVCKLCNKSYPSGKSLGGHMRSHVIANAQKNKPISKKAPIFTTVYDDHDVVDDDDDDDDDDDEQEEEEEDDVSERETEMGNEGKNSGYGLRENPKKSWRLVNSKLPNKFSGKFLHHTFHNLQQEEKEKEKERVCKQCGKGFHSLKALCGHMSSHSDHKEKNFKDDDDDDDDDDICWSSDSKEQLILAMESHSDNHHHRNNHHNISKRRTRSSLSRYKSITAVDSLSPPTTGGAGSGGGGNGGGSSSNHSEIEQHEQEEVAMCLMMLSRDSSGVRTCFNFAAESSDNNSVILEGGSSSNYVGIGVRRKDISLIHDDHKIKHQQVIVIAKEDANVNVMNNASNHQEINNSDSGYFENGAKELESDDSVDGFVRNFGFKKPKIDFGSRVFEDPIHVDNDDSKKKRIREIGTNFNSDSPESDEKCSKKIIMKQDYYSYTKNNNNNSIKKGNKYECWICKRTFKTHQALGGHIISHRKTGDNNNIDSSNSAKKEHKNGSNSKNLVAATTSTNTNTTTTTTKIVSSSKAKKVKGHKCPYCPRVFKSGQALGGHKRSHMLGGASAEVVNLHLDAEKSRIERERAPPPPRPPPPEPEHQHQLPPLIDLNFPPMEEEGCVWHGDG